MAYKIVYTKFYLDKLSKLLSYLDNEWENLVTTAFEHQLNLKIIQLSNHPFIGNLQQTKKVRSLIIGKHNRLYYRVKDETMIIIDLLDMRINTANNPYKK